MSLDEAIRRGEAMLGLNPPALLDSRLATTAAELEARCERLGDVPGGETIERVAQRLREALAEGRPESLSRRDWRLLPWALWAGEPPLAAEPRVLDLLSRRLRREHRRSEVKSLMAAYVQAFAPGREGIAAVSRLLVELVELWDWAWRERQRRHQLLDPEQGPSAILAHCRRYHAGPRAALEDLGIGRHPHLGLPLAAYLRGLEALRSALAQAKPKIERLNLMLDWALAPDGKLLARVALAEALLLPWLDRSPPPDLHERIQAFLLKHYGDPRLRINSWTGISEDAKAVFRRWLVKVALDQFFNIIDEIIGQANFKQQWKYRRLFWTAWFSHNMITDAHVMFASKGYNLIRNRFGRDLPCARLESGGPKAVDVNHSVLLMRIGRLIIADWSHNGQCVIWNERHSNVPQFGRHAYTSEDVHWAKADFSVYHQGSQNRRWQKKVREYIHSQTGILLRDGTF